MEYRKRIWQLSMVLSLVIIICFSGINVVYAEDKQVENEEQIEEVKLWNDIYRKTVEWEISPQKNM